MIAIDTNILVYAFDTSEDKKHEACKQLFKKIMNGDQEAAVTNQILAELAVVLRTKVKKPARPQDIQTIIEAIMKSPHWTIIDYSAQHVLQAIGEQGDFWDNLIEATLQNTGVQRIVTENTRHFPTLKATCPF